MTQQRTLLDVRRSPNLGVSGDPQPVETEIVQLAYVHLGYQSRYPVILLKTLVFVGDLAAFTHLTCAKYCTSSAVLVHFEEVLRFET